MEKIVITPKRKSSIAFLKKLFNEIESIDDVEIIDDDEVKDNELLKKMKKNRKSGKVSYESVMKTLDKVISR